MRMKCLPAGMLGLLGLAAIMGEPLSIATPAAAQSPQRILSIGGDITETLYALGIESSIVAVDATSQFPPQALKEKTNVGYLRALSPEGVLSAGATLIIASDKAGPPDVVKTLKASTRYVEVGEGDGPDGVPGKIEAIASAVGAAEAGARLAAVVSADLKQLEKERSGIHTPQRALFVLNMQGGRMTVAGSGTAADAMLRLAGLTNAAADAKGYKPVGDENLLALSPDIVLVMRAAGVHDAGDASASPALLSTPAGRDKRIYAVDGASLLSFGPRVAGAARDLMRKAYPSLAAGPAATR